MANAILSGNSKTPGGNTKMTNITNQNNRRTFSIDEVRYMKRVKRGDKAYPSLRGEGVTPAELPCGQQDKGNPLSNYNQILEHGVIVIQLEKAIRRMADRGVFRQAGISTAVREGHWEALLDHYAQTTGINYHIQLNQAGIQSVTSTIKTEQGRVLIVGLSQILVDQVRNQLV